MDAVKLAFTNSKEKIIDGDYLQDGIIAISNGNIVTGTSLEYNDYIVMINDNQKL